MKKPFSIKIFLPGGDAEGIRIIEKTNWTGSGIFMPRPMMAEAMKREELGRTGVYVLVGPAEDSSLPRVYVGEGDPIKPRLSQHNINKDFWTWCLGFTSKDNSLNKAHVQHIESRLIELAKAAKQCTLENANQPAAPSLSEVDKADADSFLEEMLLCFPLVEVHYFNLPHVKQSQQKRLYLESRGVKAQGQETSSGFLVFKQSEAAMNVTNSASSSIIAKRQSLISNGVLASVNNALVFTQDYEFGSPSTAAAVVIGKSANGRTMWKTASGKTLKEIQEEAITTS